MTSKENELIKDVEGFHLDRDFKFEFRVVLANQNITILRFWSECRHESVQKFSLATLQINEFSDARYSLLAPTEWS